jgi:hypothetical protein
MRAGSYATHPDPNIDPTLRHQLAQMWKVCVDLWSPNRINFAEERPADADDEVRGGRGL